jgi:acetyl-CoA acetyltransferase
MSGRFASSNKVALVGYSQSMVQRHAALPLGALAIDTARAAIADAGLRIADVDGFVASALLPTGGGHAVEDGVSVVTPGWMAENLGADAAYVSGFQGIGQIPGSVAIAVNALGSGACDYVLLHRALYNPPGRSYSMNSAPVAAGPMQWSMPQGFFGPAMAIAPTYNEYLQRYGASRDAMAAVVTEARKNGARLPWSYWYKQPLTRDEYLAAPMISDPMGRLDCDIPVDGVACFVLTTAERAKDLPHKPVYVSGYAFSPPPPRRSPLHWPLDDVMGGGAVTAARLWENSGVSAAEVDLPQLYDGFSPYIYFWLEVLGFCPVGEAHRFVQDGGIDGDAAGGLPILTGGGALGTGRMHGIPQMLECYLQLAGRAGDRQRDARIGLACHSSPHFGGAVVYSAEAL